MNKIKTWEEIESDFHHMNNMSCRPDFRKLSTGYVTDENQSVKWNREQVELNNQNYQKAVAELKSKRIRREMPYMKIFSKRFSMKLDIVFQETQQLKYGITLMQKGIRVDG